MKSVTILACLFFCSGALACEPSIVGTWQSDGHATLAFARKNAKLEPRQEAFLAALVGQMTVEVSEEQIHLRMPDLEVPVNGEIKLFKGFEEEMKPNVLFCDSRKTVLSSTDSAGKVDVANYHFVSPDQMWVYMGGNDPAVPDFHTREYFKRIR